MFRVPWPKKVGSVGRPFFFFFEIEFLNWIFSRENTYNDQSKSMLEKQNETDRNKLNCTCFSHFYTLFIYFFFKMQKKSASVGGLKLGSIGEPETHLFFWPKKRKIVKSC